MNKVLVRTQENPLLSTDFVPEGVYVQKLLTANFESFGEALYVWTHSDGFESRDSKDFDSITVKAFCKANLIPYATFDLDDSTTGKQYFETDDWVYEFLRKHEYLRMGQGLYVKLDEGNRPISHFQVSANRSMNVDATISGAEYLTVEFAALASKKLMEDNTMKDKSPYGEVLIVQGPTGPQMTLDKGYIENTRIAKPEYYPYLDGGLHDLIREFMASDEAVLLLMGPPGTGKSSAVAAAVEELNLFPIYAKKSEVVTHPGFVSFVCKTSDGVMARVEGSKEKKRQDLFKSRTVMSVEYPARPEGDGMMKSYNYAIAESKESLDVPEVEAAGGESSQVPHVDLSDEEIRIPIIVIEDGDELIAPRNQGNGNMLMAELLNETDGIGSNYTRKLIITTNLTNTKSIDEALLRPGRCYEAVFCRLLTPDEAIAARAAAGLPEFAELPTKEVSLAEALRKPRKKIAISKGRATLGF